MGVFGGERATYHVSERDRNLRCARQEEMMETFRWLGWGNAPLCTSRQSIAFKIKASTTNTCIRFKKISYQCCLNIRTMIKDITRRILGSITSALKGKESPYGHAAYTPCETIVNTFHVHHVVHRCRRQQRNHCNIVGHKWFTKEGLPQGLLPDVSTPTPVAARLQ